MKYERPNIDELKSEFERLTAEFSKADSYEKAKAIFLSKDKLERHIYTLISLVNIRHSIDTRDKYYDDENEFWDDTYPELQEKLDEWTRVLLETPYRSELEAEFGDVVFINAEIEIKSFDPSIIPLLQDENKLTTEYSKLIASAQIPFRGEVYTLSQLGKYKKDSDDEIRLEAWKADGAWLKENSPKMDEIYDKLVKIRHKISQELGLKDYVELGYYRMQRNCYDRTDVEKFREAVVKYIVPVADKVRRAQAARIGADYPMSFSDAGLMFRSGNANPKGDANDILEAGRKFYDELSPETSEFFNMMLECELMDVLSTEGKEGGGYCTGIHDYEVPFIFANFNGTTADVEVVTHEAGHAFADWMNRKRIPVSTIWPTMEGCEVHSMSMEYFAWRAHDDFYGEDARKACYTHLAESLTFIPYGTMVDHFQHIVYEHPEMSPAERHAEWKRLLGIYMPHLKLDGAIPFYADAMGWQRQSHIYTTPFYYIDYCLAQTVALGFWAMIQEDPDAAWERYMAYTTQGGSDVFTKIIEKAGLASPFEGDTLRKVCEKAGAWLDAYDLSGIE